MKIFRIILTLILSICIVFTLIIGKNLINANVNIDNAEKINYIVTIWHVDTFEGGTGSRSKFLLNTSKSFEKKYKNVLIMVVNHTPESVEENFTKGIFPDLISYGNGVNVYNLNMLNCNVEFKFGNIGNNLFAVPWCRGGYVLFENENLIKNKAAKKINNIIVSKSNFNQPLVSAILEDYKINNYQMQSPLDAYVSFVNGKSPYLLGTQRDIVRLSNRGLKVKITPLTIFNDLYQYISITTLNKEKLYYCQLFINHLLSLEIQQKLPEISMFSCFYSNNYDNINLKKMDLINFKYSISPYLQLSTINEIEQLSIKTINSE